MTEIDPTSKVLGELLSEARNSRRQREEIFSQLNDIKKNMVKRDEYEKHTTEVHILLSDYKTTKAKAVGVLTTVAFMGAGALEVIKILGKKVGV